jgi:hypothetical protein
MAYDDMSDDDMSDDDIGDDGMGVDDIGDDDLGAFDLGAFDLGAFDTSDTGSPWDTGTDAERAAMHKAFQTIYEKAYPRLCHIVSNRGLPDPDNTLGDISELFCRVFPAMYREEQAKLAAGKPPPYKWVPWICRVAFFRVIDEMRKLGLITRKRPAKAGAAAPPPDDEQEDTPDKNHPRRRELPLEFADNLRAPEESDPAVIFDLYDGDLDAAHERRIDEQERCTEEHKQRVEALKAARARLAIEFPQLAAGMDTFLNGLSDAESACHLNITRYALYRLRRSALRQLRLYFAEQGFTVPDKPPPTLGRKMPLQPAES